MSENQSAQFNKLVNEISVVKTDIQKELNDMSDDIMGIKNTI